MGRGTIMLMKGNVERRGSEGDSGDNELVMIRREENTTSQFGTGKGEGGKQ